MRTERACGAHEQWGLDVCQVGWTGGHLTKGKKPVGCKAF